MKCIARFILVVMSVSTSAFAQGGRGAPPPPAPLEPGASQADVDKAVLALPENLRNQATVIKWKPDFTYDTLRKGANGLVCYDRSGFPLQQPFAVECTSAAADREHARPHLTVAVPGATAESLGLPDKATQSGIWIMNAGTTTAHLMIPGQ